MVSKAIYMDEEQEGSLGKPLLFHRYSLCLPLMETKKVTNRCRFRGEEISRFTENRQKTIGCSKEVTKPGKFHGNQKDTFPYSLSFFH